MFHHNKANPLRQRQLNNDNSHSLIYSIGQYRKSVTNLAIGCIRKQSLIAIGSKPQQPHYRRDKINYRNKQNPMKQQIRIASIAHSNSIPTKKKRYDYGITLQSSINQNKQQQQQSVMNSTLHYHDNRMNSHSIYKNKDSQNHHYLTQPFTIEQLKLGLKDIQNRRSYKNLSAIQYNNNNDRDNFITNGDIIKSNQKKNKYKQSKSKQKPLQLFDKITLSKQNISLQRHNQGDSNKKSSSISISKPTQKNTIKINYKKQTQQQQSSSSSSINYPKTQTYTSRSDYNIQKLANKLDSYIKKHIKHY